MKLLSEPRLDTIEMPENLAVAMMVMQARQRHAAQGGGALDFVHYAFGGSPFPVPAAVQEALSEASGQGEYRPAEGIAPLREQIGRFWDKHFGMTIDPGRMVVVPGSKQGIYNTLALLQGPVILPAPSWVGYLPIARLLDKKIIVLPTRAEDDYRITAEGLDAQCRELADAPQSFLILNSPNNPTGAVYSRSELEALAAVCRKHNVIVISDEIYSLITYDPAGFTSMAQIYPEGTFITTGISKYAGAGGYRLGVTILPETCTEQQLLNFRKVGAATYTNAASPVQFAAIAAFGTDPAMDAYIDAQRNLHRMMTTELARRFGELPGVTTTTPQGSFYFFANFDARGDELRAKGIADSRTMATRLLEEPCRVAMVSGASLLMPPESLTFRIAAVDYDGAAVMKAYEQERPQGLQAERAFVAQHAAGLLSGVERLRSFLDSL